jgi:leader peptidase (prepilin peptidase) / N-methyltransferase
MNVLVLASMASAGLIVGIVLPRAMRRTVDDIDSARARNVVVALGTALLFATVTLRFGAGAELPPYLYLATVGVALTLIDFDLRRLPDSVILPSYIVTLVLLMPASASTGDVYAATRAIAGMFALLAVYFALAVAYPNGLSFGDVKLAGLVGLYLGWLSWNALFVTVSGSLLIACGVGAVRVVIHHGPQSAAVRVAPCLVTAALLALFVTAPLSSWYSSVLPA